MNLLEIFGISARFCRTFGNFQEFKGILEILTDFGIFLGFLRDFLGIFAYEVYEDFQSNTPSEYPRLEDNRQSLCLKLFNKLKTQPSLKLSHLVPCTRYESHGRLLRGRYRNSFFPTMTEIYNQYYLSSSKF